QELLLEAAKHPKHRGEVPGATHTFSLENPLCGDEVSFTAKIQDGRIQDLRFDGKGCFISQASASLLADLVQGLTIAELRDRLELVRKGMHGEPLSKEKLGDLCALEGVKKFPIRIKCALLPFEALEKMTRA